MQKVKVMSVFALIDICSRGMRKCDNDIMAPDYMVQIRKEKKCAKKL